MSADPTAATILTVDLGALKANYRSMKERAGSAECAAVIKANAYGTGAAEVIRALSREGCTTFFVATFAEGTAARSSTPDATIYVLDGLFPESAPAFAEAGLRPVLSSLAEVQEWGRFCRERDVPLSAALHVDTGMNRLGMPKYETERLARSPAPLDAFGAALLISHLACADTPDNPMNETQRAAFDEIRAKLPPLPASLANSGGVFLGESYHYDMVRPGIALYGGRAAQGQPDLAPVVQVHARIAQVHEAEPGETVGYGAAQTLVRHSRIATLALGYADGVFRCLGVQDDRAGLTGYIGEHRAPVLGRVSMDLVTLDVTDVPEKLAQRGAWVEILGPHASLDDVAEQADTIGYEVLTSLGRRATRVYVDGGRAETA